MYAVVDIESSGGRFSEERIIEIAIIKYDGEKEIDRFSSLVNPLRKIDSYVTELTGISESTVRTAPRFHEIAKRIIEITDSCLLVAHNALRDYQILRQEFARLGYIYQRNTACTVELSKNLIPNIPSYSLGNLCKSLGIPIVDRHRALGDTIATTELLKILLEKDTKKNIERSALKPVEELSELDKKLYLLKDTLPSYLGVFYLYNKNSEVFYVGTSNNIYKEINVIFSLNTFLAQKIKKEIEQISFEDTGSAFIAHIKQTEFILNNSPKLNKKLPKYTHQISPKIFPPDKTLLVIDKGKKHGQKSVVIVEKGVLLGYAYFTLNNQIEDLNILKTLLTPIQNPDILIKNLQTFIRRRHYEKLIYI